MADEFYLKVPAFHVTFRDLLHAVNRHGTDGFTSPPKEGVLRIFSPWKIQRLRSGLNPTNVGTKGQHATSRPPKPLCGALFSEKFEIGVLTHLSPLNGRATWSVRRKYSYCSLSCESFTSLFVAWLPYPCVQLVHLRRVLLIFLFYPKFILPFLACDAYWWVTGLWIVESRLEAAMTSFSHNSLLWNGEKAV